MEKTPNFTAEQEQIIRGFTGTGEGGRLCYEDAKAIAADARMNDAEGKSRSPKSIVAKINRMGVGYAKATPTRKDGSKIETKAKLVEEIAKAAGVSFEALDKAARGDLVKLRDFVARKAA